jgi:D-aspartate ligase
VLVLGRGITALGVIRALGRKGIPSVSTAPLGEWTTHSRWYHKAQAPIEETADPASLEESLMRLGIQRAVLMPCNDRWAVAVSRLSPAVADRFPASICRPEVLDVFLDKGAFATVLEAHDVPHPHTVCVNTESDLESVTDEYIAQYFLKPRDSKAFLERFGVKAFHFADRPDMYRRWHQMHDTGLAAVLQEFIPGSPAAHYFIDGFIDREGAVRALFARRRLRIYPPDFGNSTAMVSVSLDVVSRGARDLLRLLASVGYRGIFSAELKLDQRDGLLKMLEVNSRPWWYVEFAALCGVDVCGLAYRDALRESLTTVTDYPIGRRYAIASLDLRALFDLRARGQIGFRTWLLESARAFSGGRPCDDPMPAVAKGLTLARGTLRRARKSRNT